MKLNILLKNRRFENFVKEFKFQGDIYIEKKVFSDEIGLCGTVDFTEIIDNKIVNIKDFKTNEKMPNDYSFGRRMNYPLENLWDSNLTKYSLQISIYLYLLSEKFNLKIGDDNCLFWINYKKQEVKKIPVQYMKTEVINMISHYISEKSDFEWDF
ncbi:MAG: hypothetical protein AABY22_03215 [Nanoarchaeota archaeon]